MQSFYNYFSSPRYIMKKPIDDKSKFFDVDVALDFGNIVKSEYIPYEEYQIKKIEVKNDDERKQLMVMKYEFLLLDLTLYLDTHPDGKEAKKLYVKTRKEYHNFINQNQEVLEEKQNWPWEEWMY